jgi:hypothetical protein
MQIVSRFDPVPMAFLLEDSSALRNRSISGHRVTHDAGLARAHEQPLPRVASARGVGGAATNTE